MSQYIQNYAEEYTFEIKNDIEKYLSTHPDRKVHTISMCGGSSCAYLKAIVVYEDKDEA